MWDGVLSDPSLREFISNGVVDRLRRDLCNKIDPDSDEKNRISLLDIRDQLIQSELNLAASRRQ